uniref:Calcineurin-like phosphoesterase domain-containing protein n=1 Tax=Kalanchoe fedtschenkoi TaxID=63787 RepID=A0A7N0VGT4_KALFE
MVTSDRKARWTLCSLLYLTLILCSVYLLQALISRRLLLLSDRQAVHVKRSPHLPLRFRSDGTFKILQVADMHFGNGAATHCRDVLPSQFYSCSDHNTTYFVQNLINLEQPDFVAFTGDNIFGTSATDAAESLFKAFSPVLKSGIPWAAVLGNHDQESTMTREELMSFISLMDYSVSRINPITEGSGSSSKRNVKQKIDGFGNYDVQVYGAPGSPFANSSVLNLFFLDSGDRETVDGIRTYGWIKESQLRWLHDAATRFKDQQWHNDGSTHASYRPPALTFFHIPIPEVRHLYGKSITGQFQEGVACSRMNSGVLKTLASIGDIKAVFMGHDHTNDFCGKLDGIWLCYGGGSGYHGYGKAGWARRARVILAELKESSEGRRGVGRIKTWKRLDDEKLSKIDEQVLWDGTVTL